MKSFWKFLCLVTVALLIFAGCDQQEEPPNTGDTSGDIVSDSGSESTSDTADTTEPAGPVDTFDPSADTRYGTAVNVDCDAMWYMYTANDKKLENVEQMCIDWFNSHYKDVGVSDIMYHIDQHVPSTTRESYMDFYLEAKETGKTLDETSATHGELMYRIYEEHNVDPYAVWFALCEENGINPWLSFRMNDIHAPALGYECTDFYYEAKEKGWLISSNGRSGWSAVYPDCLNYAIPEVRQYFIDYIDEILGRYDVYGIELDWQREIHNFVDENKDNCKYMDIFMEAVNEVVAKYEEQYGHEIKIISRVARSIEVNQYFGLDTVNWAKNDWVDILVPSSHGPTDSAIPVAEWKEALDPYGVELYVGFEFVTIGDGYPHTENTLAAFTSMYLQQGADKIYLYNMFNASNWKYKICASLEAALKYVKRQYLVTSQVKTPRLIAGFNYTPLPIEVRGGKESKAVELLHGRLATNKDTYIYIGVGTKTQEEVEGYNFKVMYNGVECEYTGRAMRSYISLFDATKTVLAFRVPKEAWEMSEAAQITFISDQYVSVDYVELMNGKPAVG